MITHIQQHLDYLFFVYGLAFFWVASICATIPRESGRGAPWLWLGLFGAFHGLSEWLEIFLMDLTYNPAVDMAKFAAMALSAGFLCEFARRALGGLQGKGPRAWLYVPLLALAASGALGGASIPETLNAMAATTRYALLLTGGLGAAWALYQLGKLDASTQGILTITAIALIGYTLSAGVIVTRAPIFPAMTLNNAWFLSAVGVPIQLVRASCGVLLGASLWRYSRRLRQVELSPKGNDSVTPLIYGLNLMLAVTLVAGWWFAEFASAWSDGEARDMLRAQAATAAAGFMPLLAPLKGTTVDGTDAGLRQLRAQLQAVGQANAELRSGRLLILRGGHILEAMTFDAKEPGRSAAGRAYERPPREVLEAFSSGRVTSLGPRHGSTGDLLSAFAPIRDPGTQAVAGVLGIDIDAAGWKHSMDGFRLVAISVTILIAVLAILFFILRERMWRLAQLATRSENRLVAAQEMVHLGSWSYDRWSGNAGWSEELFHICGRDPKLGAPSDPEQLQALIHPQDWPQVRAVIGRAVEQGADTWIEFRVVRPDSSLRQVEASAHACRNNGGRVVALTGTVQDVTDRRLATEKLRLSEEKLRTMFELSPLGIARNSMDGEFVEANASFLNIVGYTLDALDRLSYWELTPESYADQEAQQLESLRTTGRYGPYEKEYINSRGQRVPVRLNGILITGSDGEKYIWSMVEDISLLSTLFDQVRVAAAAFESQEAMMITDASNVILRVNQAFIEITGYTAGDAVGQTPRLLKSGRHDADFFRAMWEAINDTGKWQGEIWDRRKSGEEYPKWLTITAVKNDKGLVTNYISVHHDITKRKQAEEKISELAFFDQLTGLPNRTLLLDRLKQAMAASSRTGRFGALLFIDLDRFKTLNDTLGHDMGDLLLKQVAQRLTKCIRAGDTAARLGGDEFVVMLAGLSLNVEDAAAHTKIIGEKMLSALNLPYQLNQVAYHCTASIGATSFTGGLVTIDELMKQADLAMYKSKDAGRNALHFFDPRMESAVRERAAAEDDLRSAVEEKRFVLHYQAQVVDRRVIGAEALVRWQHPKRGLVYPDGFITLSEETGLMLPLGHWVLETACDQLAAWAIQPGMSHLILAVNVSVHQIRQTDFVDQVLSVLARSGADPHRLKLELTESVMITNTEDTIAKMTALKAKGVGFSLDDFGTGYSSLSYLKRLPLDQLKIDRSFVKDILIDPIDAAIAKMIITLGENLGLAVIAEGVETEAQREFLAHLGCHAYQGYLFSRPLPLDEFEDLVQQA